MFVHSKLNTNSGAFYLCNPSISIELLLPCVVNSATRGVALTSTKTLSRKVPSEDKSAVHRTGRIPSLLKRHPSIVSTAVSAYRVRNARNNQSKISSIFATCLFSFVNGDEHEFVIVSRLQKVLMYIKKLNTTN